MVNVLVAELEREKNVQRMRTSRGQKFDRLKEKIEEERKEVSVRPKNKDEGGRIKNSIEQVRLNNVGARSEEGSRKQVERIKVKVESPENVELKSRVNILRQDL